MYGAFSRVQDLLNYSLEIPSQLRMLFSFVKHPVPTWAGFTSDSVTDWTVVSEVMTRNPWVMRLRRFRHTFAFSRRLPQRNLHTHSICVYVCLYIYKHFCATDC